MKHQRLRGFAGVRSEIQRNFSSVRHQRPLVAKAGPTNKYAALKLVVLESVQLQADEGRSTPG